MTHKELEKAWTAIEHLTEHVKAAYGEDELE